MSGSIFDLTAPGARGRLLRNPKLWCRGEETLRPPEAGERTQWIGSQLLLCPGAEVPAASWTMAKKFVATAGSCRRLMGKVERLMCAGAQRADKRSLVYSGSAVAELTRNKQSNVVKTIINHPFGNGFCSHLW